MKNFARRGFRLSTASLETRIAYTAFLVLMLPAAASLLALSFGRMGFSIDGIATYYRGGEGEMSFPRTFWQMVEVSHFHLFSVPVVVLILSHLLFAAVDSPRLRIGLVLVTFVGAFLEIGSPYAIRYLSAGFAWTLLLGWIGLGGGLLAMTLCTIVGLWRRE